MNFVAVFEKDFYEEVKKVPRSGRNQKLITAFENSDYSIVEVINFRYKTINICANALRCTIKNLHKESTIKVHCNSFTNKVYLLKVPSKDRISL